MSGPEDEGQPPRRPRRQAVFLVVALVVLLGAAVLIWLRFSGRSRPPGRDETLREEVNKQIQRRVQESLKLLDRGGPR